MAVRIANLVKIYIVGVLPARKSVHAGRIRRKISAMHRNGANSFHKTGVRMLCIVVPLIQVPHKLLSGTVRTWSGHGVG